MTSITPFRATDLLSLSAVNLDVLTENYFIGFYLEYLCTWPTMFFKSENPEGVCTGYMMGKSEGQGKEWHSHITALTVSYDYRRIGLARTLVNQLVTSSEDNAYNCYFMDLFVRSTNDLAINLYRGFGFDIFRRVVGYYDERNGSAPEDAFGKLYYFLKCWHLLTQSRYEAAIKKGCKAREFNRRQLQVESFITPQ